MTHPTTSTARSSDEPPGGDFTAPERLRAFWALMAETWGARWLEQNGDEPPKAWRLMLASLTRAEAYAGYLACKRESPAHPPTLAQFEQLTAAELQSRRPAAPYHRDARESGLLALGAPTRGDSPVAARHRDMIRRMLNGTGIEASEATALPELTAVGGKAVRPDPRDRQAEAGAEKARAPRPSTGDDSVGDDGALHQPGQSRTQEEGPQC